MIRIRQPERGSDEEKRAARNAVLQNLAFFVGSILLIRVAPAIIRSFE